MVTWQQLAALPVFPEFYRLARRLFGMNIALLDPEGREGLVLGKGRELNPFCKAIQQRPGGLARCTQCDAHHARLAAASHQPLRYVCHAGLTEFMIPILVDDRIVGHLQCGQVLDRPLTDAAWAAIRRRIAWIGENPNRLRSLCRRSQRIPPATQKDLIALLQLFAHHVAIAHARLLILDQDPTDRILAKARAFLQARFQEPVSLDQVAAAAGASKRNLVRLFRRKTGATVLAHLHQLRVAAACEQLRQTHAPIAQIALECGFGSIQHFNRVFRKWKHATPHAWRRQARRAPYG